MKRFMSFVLAFACMCAALTPLIVLAESSAFVEPESFTEKELSILYSFSDESLQKLYQKLPEHQDFPSAPTVQDILSSGGKCLVWLSRTGSCYHLDYGCGNMKNPLPTTLSFA